MQTLIPRLTSWLVFALYVASNFVFIYACPDHTAATFLKIYALSGLIFSFLGTSIYSGMKNWKIDLAIAVVASVTLFFISQNKYDQLSTNKLLFSIAAALPIIVDFGVAQLNRPYILTFQRIGTALTSLFLLNDFFFALFIRSSWLLIFVYLCACLKFYNQAGPKFVIDKFKISYSGLTCLLYYGGLYITPILTPIFQKELYIFYSIIGNIILKIQDYYIKQFVCERCYKPIPAQSVSMLLVTACVLAFSIYTGVMTLVLLPFVIGLIFTGRILRFASWN